MISLNLGDFHFEEKGHIYTLNGIVIPSVSQIIRPVSNYEYGSINPTVLERAAIKGTKVHQAIEDFNDFGVIAIDDDLRGYVDGYIDWADKNKPDILGAEIKFYHKILRYAGTADLLANIDGKLNLVDFKTSFKVVDKNYRLQLEAYSRALSSFGVKVERKVILHLKSDGRYEEIEYPEDDIEAWTVFSGCKSVYDWCIK